jgi:hypothetical protein
VDDESRLYVQTYETKDGRSEYIYDVFDEKGILILHQSLPIKPGG